MKTSLDSKKTIEQIDWHDSYNLFIRGEKGYLNSRLSKGDMFYRLFLSDCCLGKACYEKCKFKYNHSSADIRIGDLWGNTYADNEYGVSAAISFTEKGDELLHKCGCNLVEHPFEIVAEGQMKKMPVKSKLYLKVMYKIRKNTTLDGVFSVIQNQDMYNRLLRYIKHPFRSIRNLLRF